LLEVLELEHPVLVGVQVAVGNERGGKANDTRPAHLVEDEAFQGQHVRMFAETGVDVDLLPHGPVAPVVMAVLEDALLHPRVRDQVDMDRQTVELGDLGPQHGSHRVAGQLLLGK
jgi:hypothetical protein